MIMDIHIHEKRFSSDSSISLEQIVACAKGIGLDGICITDHDSMQIKEAAEEYALKTGFTIIVGAEVLTFEGDILVFGLDKLPNEMVSAQHLLNMVKQAGGVAVSAHPYRQNNRGLGERIRKVSGLHGIEAFNGSTPPHHNMYAYGIALEYGLAALGASDAHNVEAIGRYATVFPESIRDTRDFIEAIKQGGTYPAVLTSGGYRVIDLESFLYQPELAAPVKKRTILRATIKKGWIT